ncbi:carbon-nitrogen hydrolase family protein [Aestuariirhabdus litorea]|uniref:Carbon-nitrogen hydrolase family protein n=1 Tax=Aestuariirhabdus litorea TaxID=2528527 RepID=A0A3P3VHR1_9GAMM|nr:carbon-nitrogen hydrolase family protein [Aestuariirhabdus litorea]RRJ82262.1 carbon-nitrogen hydrolase family protein [Aestuariirhabdus litorea]RWW92429.1 carbon-nitrogen hydrolase family protein [Endozoicomonadaceae bacterium GTF-13]
MVKVAITQKPPVLLDLHASLARAVETIEEAAGNGARLIVFPEAYLPGYPTWIWRLRPGGDIGLGNEIHARLRANSVDLQAGDLDPIAQAAAKHQIVVVMGGHELESEFSGSTLFNSLFVFDADGSLVNRHRKLMPTNPERMVWGMGDASGLKVVETAVGRLGCLICWESYMPLARFALYSQNIDIYIAPTWDNGDTWVASMNHIAREGGCWVLSTATAISGNDIPADFPGKAQLFDGDEWINTGGAVVVKPFGGIAAGPMHKQKAVLYADIDLEASKNARKSLDVTGHYGRPDVFQLSVDRGNVAPVSFKGEQ